MNLKLVSGRSTVPQQLDIFADELIKMYWILPKNTAITLHDLTNLLYYIIEKISALFVIGDMLAED